MPSQISARQRQVMRIAQRRAQVAALYHVHKTQNEIAERFGISQKQISRDLTAIRAEWKTQAVAEIAQLKAEELAFSYAQRTSALAEWEKTRDPRHMLLVIRWSERIALIYGLDAAVKQAIAIAPLPATEMTDDELAAIAAGNQPSASGADPPPAT